MKSNNIPGYLNERLPRPGERVEVVNCHSTCFKQWGKVIYIDLGHLLFQVHLDDYVEPVWFSRFDIAWDHGH